VKLFVIKEAKCKHSSILTFMQNTKSLYNCNNCQKATEAKKNDFRISSLETATGRQNYKSIEK
jgi:hypothetical protein